MIVALLGYYAQAANEVLEVELHDWGLHDHRDAVYYPVQATFDGQNPYDTATYMADYPTRQHFPVYAPAFVVLHAPFAVLPLGLSAFVYGMFLIGVFIATAWVAVRVSGRAGPLWLVAGVATAMMVTQPSLHNFLVANNGAVFGLASIVSVYWWRRRPTVAGASLGLATAKPQFFLPLALISAVRQQREPWLTAAGVALLLSLPLGIAYIAWSGGISSFVEIVGDNIDFADSAAGGPSSNRIDADALAMRIAGTETVLGVTLFVNALIMALAATAVWRFDRRGDDCVHLVALATALGIALAAVHHPYDVLIILVPTAALFLSTTGWGSLGSRERTTLKVLMGAVLVNYSTSDIILDRIDPSDGALRVLRSVNPILLLFALSIVVAHSFWQRTDVALDSEVSDDALA